MNIIKSVPITAAGEIEIAAYPKVVWDVIAGINRWPRWNPDVKSAHLEGKLSPGSRFLWRAGPRQGMPMTIASTIQKVERPRTLAWTGKTLGIKAVHVWRLDQRGDITIVRTKESWEGLLPQIFHSPMQKMLKNSICAGLRSLKAEAERRLRL